MIDDQNTMKTVNSHTLINKRYSKHNKETCTKAFYQ